MKFCHPPAEAERVLSDKKSVRYDMKIERYRKGSFSVIGKEGSTLEGAGFVQKLWADANGHFDEVVSLAERDGQGNLIGIWGAMTDFSRSFRPWEKDFGEGLYLAGVECADDAEAPEGWSKWTVPGYEYIRVEAEGESTFSDVLAYMSANQIPLIGAVQDFTCPQTGKNYMLFPVGVI